MRCQSMLQQATGESLIPLAHRKLHLLPSNRDSLTAPIFAESYREINDSTSSHLALKPPFIFPSPPLPQAGEHI